MEQETEYPYKAYDGTFAYKEICEIQVSAFTDDTVKSPPALMAAVAEGPVSIALNASGIAFQLYHGGIMKHFCGTSLDHRVLLVVYGVVYVKNTGSLRTHGEPVGMNHVISGSTEMLKKVNQVSVVFKWRPLVQFSQIKSEIKKIKLN